MIKMVVTDIDGTILKKDFTVSNNVINAINELTKKNIKVVLATGRMYCAAIKIAKILNISTPLVCYQGALIKNSCNDKKTLYVDPVKPNLALEILQELKNKNIHTNLYLNDELFCEHDNDIIKDYTNKRLIPYKIVENLLDLDLNNQVNKILAIDPDTKLIENLTCELQEKYKNSLYIVRSTKNFCEISSKNSNKGTAVRFLSNLFNIKKDEILAIGDEDNDIDLLKSAKVKIAMGNASENLKKEANYITKSIDEDGFAFAVEKYCF